MWGSRHPAMRSATSMPLALVFYGLERETPIEKAAHQLIDRCVLHFNREMQTVLRS